MLIPDKDDLRVLFGTECRRLLTEYGLTQKKGADMYTSVGNAVLPDGFVLDEDRLNRLINGEVQVNSDEWTVFCWVSPNLERQFRELVRAKLEQPTVPPKPTPSNTELESQLGRKYHPVVFRIPVAEGEFAVHRLVAEKAILFMQKLPPEKRTLALSGGRSQYFVVEELKAFLPCAESQIPGLSVVATNAFIEPVGRTRYSATTLADSIVSLTGGQAIHPPVDNSRDVIRRYNAALAQPGVRLALIGAGGITDSFVANNAGTVVNHQGCQGDLAGIPVDNGFQPIHVQGLNDVYRQRLTLDQIRNWANGNLTKVWLLVTQEQKSQITDLVLRQQKRVVSRAYLSVELANQLLRSHSSGSGVPATSSPTQKPPQAARPRKSTNR